MTHDPFPRDRLSETVRRVPSYVRLAAAVAMDPTLAKRRRAALIAAAGYFVSPLDAIPGAVPVVGQLENIVVGIAAIRLALAGLDPERRARHLAAVGLADEDLAADMATAGVVTAWTVRAGARTTRRAAARGGSLAASGARAAGTAAAAGAASVVPRVRVVTDPVSRGVAAVTPDAARDAAARVAPAAKGVVDRMAPSARAAGSRLGDAARGVVSRGASVGEGVRGRRPAVRVSVPMRLALPGPRTAAADDTLPVEPDDAPGARGEAPESG